MPASTKHISINASRGRTSFLPKRSMIGTRDSPCSTTRCRTTTETSPWRDRCFHLWEKTWKFILDERDNCIFYLRYYSSPDFYAYERDRQQQYYHALTHRIAYLFRPETDLDMLMHQIFETMLAFAAHVMTGDMENNDLTTERTFEQIYSFIAPHFRAELTEGAGKETAVL